MKTSEEKEEFKTYPTPRGFLICEFKDYFGNHCSIQESSIATDSMLWLGAHENRMHITREHAKKIVSHLVQFIYSGDLRGESE